MTSRVFSKLLGLFFLLLVFHTAVMELVFHRFVEHAAGNTLRAAGPRGAVVRLDCAGSCAAAGCLGGWPNLCPAGPGGSICPAAGRGRAEHQALDRGGADEFAAMESALNRTAERLDADFAELESSRQELAAMLDAMQEAVVALTPEGLVRWSNAVMQRIAGTRDSRRPFLVHSVRDPELLSCVRGALERREICIGRASSMAPGRVFEISAAPLPSGGAVVVLHDVTGIEAAQKSRREFVANVSHELRTPLTSIQGYVETMIEHPIPNPETTREFLDIILKNASRMIRLTEDLLALASVESPDYKLTMQPTRASLLVKDAIQSLGGIVVDSGVKLQSSGAPDSLVMADPDAMNQVFGNLIENSLKYAKAKQADPRRRSRAGSRGGVYCGGLWPRDRLRASGAHL